MSYKDYFLSLSEEDQDEYATKAGTTGNYLRTHIFCPMNRRKIPRKRMIERLVESAPDNISIDDVLEFLYKVEVSVIEMRQRPVSSVCEGSTTPPM